MYFWLSLYFGLIISYYYGLLTYLLADVCGQGSRVQRDVGVYVWIIWPAAGRLFLTIMLYVGKWMFTQFDSKHFIAKFSLNYWYTSLCYLKGNSLVIIISMARSRRSELPNQTKTSFDWRPRSAFPGLKLGKSKIWVVTSLGLIFEKIVKKGKLIRKKFNSCLAYELMRMMKKFPKRI